MAIIDRKYDNLKLCEAAKWQSPPDHPDLVPAQEALMLEQAFAGTANNLSVGKGTEFKSWLVESAAVAAKLRSALVAGKSRDATLLIGH